ncbi:MAG: 23S rRNA (pseudouridine(1915)-N(3))-methyltransferase RlmH [Alphaproteobacteria bacterium]|nr:23S rRNA (pseudouridine(1915)-N(3))-methyltransferase RlmH [Alphaproteobacteria bacterium]
MKTLILAIGKLRGPEAAWCDEYLKRLGKTVEVRAFTVSSSLPPLEAQKAEAQLLLKAIPEKSFVVLLDERGRTLTSPDLANKLTQWHARGTVTFIIGGPDGVTEEIKTRADFTMCFGAMTWPHKLARVMLLEQLYRAQQIQAGHPYHRSGLGSDP